jgi:hypothetical protein
MESDRCWHGWQDLHILSATSFQIYMLTHTSEAKAWRTISTSCTCLNIWVIIAPPLQPPQPHPLWSKTGSKEEHFTLEPQTVFRPYFYLALPCSRVTQTLHVALSPHAPQPVPVWSKSRNNKGHFTAEAERFFVAISPSTAAGWLKHHTWHSIPTCHNKRTFSCNWAVANSTWRVRNSFSSVCRLALQRADSDITHGTPSPCSTRSARLVEIYQWLY